MKVKRYYEDRSMPKEDYHAVRIEYVCEGTQQEIQQIEEAMSAQGNPILIHEGYLDIVEDVHDEENKHVMLSLKEFDMVRESLYYILGANLEENGWSEEEINAMRTALTKVGGDIDSL